jgi:hypothetical protein
MEALGGRSSKDDADVARKLEHARDVFVHLLRAVKQIALYRHNRALWTAFAERSHQQLTTWIQKHGPFVVRVEAQNFTMLEAALLLENSDLPYQFFRDGIRQLVFRQGVTLDEVLEFALIATKNYDVPENRGEDVVQDLWKASFAHIEYMAVEGFQIEGASEEQVEVEIEQVIAYLSERLRTSIGENLPFFRVSAEDLDLDLEKAGEVITTDVDEQAVTAALKERVREELRRDDQRLVSRLADAVFGVLADGGLQDLHHRQELFARLLDAALLQEDFGTAVKILWRLRTVDAGVEWARDMVKLREFYHQQMQAVERLERIGVILDTSRPAEPQDVVRYLTSLSAAAVEPLLDVLERVSIVENRRLITEALAQISPGDEQPFVRRLEGKGSRYVHDLLHVIELLDLPSKYATYGRLLRHENPLVRLEALAVISRNRTEHGRRYVAAGMSDAFPAVRVEAARLLVAFDPRSAARDIQRAIESPEFDRRSFEERRSFHESLGNTLIPDAQTFLEHRLGQRSLFGRSRAREDKLLAVAGLGAFGSIAAYRRLQDELDQETDGDVQAALRRTLQDMRRRLFGEGTEP